MNPEEAAVGTTCDLCGKPCEVKYKNLYFDNIKQVLIFRCDKCLLDDGYGDYVSMGDK